MSVELDLRVLKRQAFRTGDACFVPKNGNLPPVCIRCGEPSARSVSRSFSWHKPALYFLILLGVIVYVIVAAFVRKSTKIDVPLCTAHFDKRKLLRNSGAVLLMSGPVIAILSATYLTDPLSAWGLILGLLSLLGGTIPFLTTTWNMMRPRYIDKEWAEFGGVSENFLAKLSGAENENEDGTNIRPVTLPLVQDKGWGWTIVFVVVGIGAWILGDAGGPETYSGAWVFVGWIFIGLAVAARKSDTFARLLPFATKDSPRPDLGKVYRVGAWITGALAFLISWIYAIVTYGFFLGVGLGWIPSLVIAVIAGLLWPVVAVAAVVLFIFILYVFNR